MAGFDNDVVYAANVDFRGVKPIVGQVTADGQLLIGSTAAPFIKVGTLTSTGGSLVPNVGSGTLNIENQRFLTAYVVDPSAVLGKQGTYSTIQAAITAALGAGGGNVFIRAGSYTENLTLAASVNLYGFKDGTFAGNAFDLVTVLGSHGAAYNGTSEIQGIAFQDNGMDPIFSISDAVNSPILNFKNCSFVSAPGRCIYVSQNGSSIVDGCTLSANSYGIQADSNGNVVLKNSIISGAIAGGINVDGSSTWTVQESSITGTSAGVLISSATASGSSRDSAFISANDALKYTAAGSWTSISDVYTGTAGVTGAAGTLSYADAVFTSSTSIAAGITQTILNWRPYATATTVGTASFDATSFTATSGAITLNTVDVPHGGTGQVTLTDHGVLVGSGVSPIDALTVGTTGQLLVGVTGADPAFGSSASADFTFTTSTAGATRTLTVSNTDNTNAASHALDQITSGGASGGDPKTTYTVTGATSFSLGIDNSASDAFVIAASTALGTTNVMSVATTGEINFPLQSAFLAYLGSDALNKTGAGAAYVLGTDALTEVFDQNSDFNTNGTFTAPVTGRYDLKTAVYIGGTTIATIFVLKLTTSNRNYYNQNARAASAQDQSTVLSTLADMDAADTATVTITVSGEAGNTDDVSGFETVTFFSGNLEC